MVTIGPIGLIANHGTNDGLGGKRDEKFYFCTKWQQQEQQQ